MNILLGVTGSVAAIKLPELVFNLQSIGDVKVVATSSAMKIIARIHGYELVRHELAHHDLRKIVTAAPVFQRSETVLRILADDHEWLWQKIGDPVLHIELKDWADVLVIAPITANTLAKMAHGLSDNLLTCIARAWPPTKPVMIAPAMNTDMWNHRLTQQHLDVLRDLYTYYPTPQIPKTMLTVVAPVEKKLACGTTGMGAMAETTEIVRCLRLLTLGAENE